MKYFHLVAWDFLEFIGGWHFSQLIHLFLLLLYYEKHKSFYIIGKIISSQSESLCSTEV